MPLSELTDMTPCLPRPDESRCERWHLNLTAGTLRISGQGSVVGTATVRGSNPGEARFSAPVQTGPGAHPASFTMGTGSFPGVKSSRGVTLTPHTLLVPWSRKGRAIPVLPLWAVRPVQSLSACTGVHFTFHFELPSSTEFVNRPRMMIFIDCNILYRFEWLLKII